MSADAGPNSTIYHIDEIDSYTHEGETSINPRSSEFIIKKGFALVISNNFYGEKNERNGNQEDKVKILELINTLSFESKIVEDEPGKPLSKKDVENALFKVATNECNDLNGADCLLVFVMSHGFTHCNEDHVSFSDGCIAVSQIVNKFANNRCTALLGKPKIFIFQNCRGFKMDHGTILTRRQSTTADCSMEIVTLANMAEFFIGYACYEGYQAYLTENGSWFIQSLVEVFTEGVKGENELHEMMIKVSRKVSTKYDDSDEFSPKSVETIIKEAPCFKSSLTKKVIFRPNNRN